MQMNAEVKAQWLAALRSGEYVQGQNYLNCDGEFCCLGVLSDLKVKGDESFSWVRKDEFDSYQVEHEGDTPQKHYLTGTLINWAGLTEDFGVQGTIETCYYNSYGSKLKFSL